MDSLVFNKAGTGNATNGAFIRYGFFNVTAEGAEVVENFFALIEVFQGFLIESGMNGFGFHGKGKGFNGILITFSFRCF